MVRLNFIDFTKQSKLSIHQFIFTHYKNQTKNNPSSMAIFEKKLREIANTIKDDFIKKNVKFTVDAIHVTYDKAPQDKTEPSETELTDEYQASLDDFKHDELRNVSFVSWKKYHLLKIA